MTLYFFSGLGADERAFQKITIPDSYKIVYIKWEAITPKETLENYCRKILPQIDLSEKFSFIGLSFGGIVAIEVAKKVLPQNVIIISSISNKKELPVYYRLIKVLKLHRIIPSKFFIKPFFLTYWAFGIKNKEERKLLGEIIRDTSPTFIKWAIGQVLLWKNEVRPSNIFHIHGSADRLFRFKKVKADVRIDKGGHFMIFNKADEISRIISNKLLQD